MQENSIGAKIRNYRQKKGLTQDALAAELHVSAQAVSKWENGQTMPDISILLPLSRVLEIGVNELLGGNSREELELAWKNVQPFGDELALLAAEDALAEFPDDEEFLCRRAESEYNLGIRKGLLKAAAFKYLGMAEEHFSELCRRFPENEKYIQKLAHVYFAKGNVDRAIDLVTPIKDADSRRRLLAKFNGGEAQICLKQQDLYRNVTETFNTLLSYNTREAINAARGLLDLMMPEDKALRSMLYSRLCLNDALLCLEEGNLDGYVEKFTSAYESVKAYDSLPRQPIKYISPLFDRLQDDRDGILQMFDFIYRVMSSEELGHPASLELRRRIAEEKLDYHRLWRHEWIAFYNFCKRFICREHYLNFGTSYNDTIDNESRKAAFLDARRSVRSGEALIEYYKNEIEQAVGGGKLNGFVAHSFNEIVAYCNCWDKKVYDRLPVSDECHNIPEGEKVLAIVEILIAKNFEHCGVEAKMISTALEWAKKNGYTLAEAYVVERKIFEDDAEKFKETFALYENLGFSLTRSLTENGQRKFVMQKDLK